MTVEQLIELLQREYRGAPVLVQVPGNGFVTSWDPIPNCALLQPHRIQSDARKGVVIIHCDQHDC